MITMRHQEELLDMLAKIAAFFDEHEIRYFLLGGSCIGALRHHGFIPWDDDADLMIDRDNYYKLLGCIDEWPYDDMDFSCIERNPAWYRPFAQFSSTRNTVYQKSLVFNHGLSLGTKIDLMIIDYVPSSRIEDYTHDFLLYQEASNYVFPYRTEVGAYANEYAAIKKRQEEIGRTAVLEELKAKLEAYTPDESDRRVVRFWSKISKGLRFYNAEWLGEPVYCDFEGLSLPVPAQAGACLRFQYGFDWYRVPPVSAAHTHKYFFNWNVPGIEYHKHLARSLDFDALDALSEKRKLANVKRMPYKRRIDAVYADIALQRMLLDFDFDSIRTQISSCDDARDDDVIRIMEPIWAARKDLARVERNKLGLPDDVIARWIAALVRCGRYYDALKAYSAFDSTYSAPMTADAITGRPSLKPFSFDDPICVVLDTVARLAAAYQDDDIAALAVLAELFDGDCRKTIPDVTLALIKLKEHGADVPESWDDLLALCDSHLSLHADNYEIMKAKGDLLERAGDSESALRLFTTVHENTRNGLDLIELETRFGFPSRFASLKEAVPS